MQKINLNLKTDLAGKTNKRWTTYQQIRKIRETYTQQQLKSLIPDPDKTWRESGISLPIANPKIIKSFSPIAYQDTSHFRGNPIEKLMPGKLTDKPVVRKIHLSNDLFFISAFITQVRLLLGIHPSLKHFGGVIQNYPYGSIMLQESMPTVISYRISHDNKKSFSWTSPALYYDMPLYDPTLGWLNGNEFMQLLPTEEDLNSFLSAIVESINHLHQMKCNQQEVRLEYISRMIGWFKKIVLNISSDPDLQALEKAKKIIINGRDFKPLREVCKLLIQKPQAQKFWRFVTPKSLALITGDLYLGNLIYNPLINKVKFIDVGHVWSIYMGDPLFDREKLWGSLKGELELLKNGYFKIKKVGLSINFSLNPDSPQTAKRAKKIFCPNSLAFYKIFPKEDRLSSNFNIRRHIINGFYALSVIPILKGKFKMARYLTAVKHLSRAAKLYKQI